MNKSKMKKKVKMSWSSGKDSAWALFKLMENDEYEISGLFSTITKKYNRISMHGVRIELLKKQAESLNLPLELIEIPHPCSNEDYEKIMGKFVGKSKKEGIDCFAFGDLYLEDVRNYRVEKLKNSGIYPIFPIWGENTKMLSEKMIESGLKTIITCINPKILPKNLIGKYYNHDFLKLLPVDVDPCGENGEFHSFTFAGPMFKKQINFKLGEVVTKDGFNFIDLIPVGE